MLSKFRTFAVFNIVLFTCFISAIGAQTALPKDKIFRQLYFQPGDWVTIGGTRYATCVASTFNMAYIGTLGGIIRYDIIRRQFLYPLTISDGLPENEIFLIGANSQSQLVWIITRHFICTFNPNTSRVQDVTPIEYLNVRDASTLDAIGFGAGSVWLRSEDRYWNSSLSYQSFSPSELPKKETIEWNNIPASSEIASRSIFVSNESGYIFIPHSNLFQDRELRQFPITGYLQDVNYNTWVTTAGAGAWFSNNGSSILSPLNYGLNASSVKAMAFDGADMWIGATANTLPGQYPSELSGLTQWNQKNDHFTYYFSSLHDNLALNEITDIEADENYIWVGTTSGLNYLNKKSNQWTIAKTYSGLKDDHIIEIVPFQKGIIVATENGLHRSILTKKGIQFQPLEIPDLWNRHVLKILPSGNSIWLGTDNGIYRLDSSFTIQNHYTALGYDIPLNSLVNQVVPAITEMANNLFFISTHSVLRFDKHKKEWESMPISGSYLQSGVYDAIADEDNLWIGLADGALQYDFELQRWAYYNKKDGIGGYSVYKILPDGDYVWFATENGLTQFYWNAEHLRSQK
ncbi:MAG TPA: hypothetical protein PKV06_00295 [bacterium]|nr:hypothetical protein [bacterium]HNB55380.1 hypothetical protein [bacterium]HND77571.1 hypothetical protein [bacterium]HNF85403.1 hypothetical protein [bacterium]HNH29970.1 hypothetical protein [bacterium]